MGKYTKLLAQVLRGNADANIDFDELCQLLLRLGFEERTRGSHHLFRKSGVAELVNLQSTGNKAKPYQVKQVRNIIVEYGLEVDD